MVQRLGLSAKWLFYKALQMLARTLLCIPCPTGHYPTTTGATMQTTTKAPKAAKAPKAFVGPMPAPATTTPAPTLQVQPTAPAAAAYGPGTVYSIGKAAAAIMPHLTLQRGCTVPVGANWRNNGHKAPNTRQIVIQALAALGTSFTHAQALAALQPLKASATLGSGSPASYVRAFVKCGYLVPVQGAA